MLRQDAPMKKKLFGTDGIRAVAGVFPLDYSSIYILGRALVSLFGEKGLEPRLIIGRDTRESGAWMEEALVRGVGEAQGEALSAGIIPTSAVSYLTKKHGFSAGIVLSASHNPYRDNGIKIFSPLGLKIDDAWEDFVEKAVWENKIKIRRKPTVIRRHAGFAADYMQYLEEEYSELGGSGRLKVVLDCANGAGSLIAPRVLRRLGFSVTAIHNRPDGRNINKACGSLHPRGLRAEVLDAGADIGVAYDGDADRALWVDERGRILNGDHTLYVMALFMQKRGLLRSKRIIGTTMSNMGLERALEKNGLVLARTRVGDKYVLDEMIRSGSNLGGEQSGHTIFLDDCPTGDGILTSLKMLGCMAVESRPLSDLVSQLEEFPQVLVNVRVREKKDLHKFPGITEALEEVRQELGKDGRIDLRYSGTEPLVRIMVEGRNREGIEKCANRLSGLITKYLGDI